MSRALSLRFQGQGPLPGHQNSPVLNSSRARPGDTDDNICYRRSALESFVRASRRCPVRLRLSELVSPAQDRDRRGENGRSLEPSIGRCLSLNEEMRSAVFQARSDPAFHISISPTFPASRRQLRHIAVSNLRLKTTRPRRSASLPPEFAARAAARPCTAAESSQSAPGRTPPPRRRAQCRP